MKVRVLGCSGAIARDCRTTSFLIDDDLLVDAGTGVGDLTLDEMALIDDVFLTHSHFDHIASLPMMLDAVAWLRQAPVRVHGLRGTLNALRRHIFNNVIWPDFSLLPSPETPLLTYREIGLGQNLLRGSRAPKRIEVLPAVHTVPACGYAVRDAAGGPNWVFTGDTERNPAFWERVNQIEVGALVIETAFSHAQRDLAALCRHLAPGSLADELARIAPGRNYPIHISHNKPADADLIMGEIAALAAGRQARGLPAWDIRRLATGDVLVF